MKHIFRMRSVILAGFLVATMFAQAQAADEWISLFNGKDLDGWTPKIRGYELGENFGNTFRVENGTICVRYDGGYEDKFANRFGHLFFKTPFSNYIVRVEYRFVGKQLSDGPGWATRNSGIMLHCQPPGTMRKDQDFPVSIEVQLLGGNGKATRTTANLCTPGTHVVYGGKLWTQHCTDSKSQTYHGEQWVTAEVEVHGTGKIIHRVNNEQVMEYEQPQFDPGDPDAKKLMQEAGSSLIAGGYISLQSESHPVEFRSVKLKVLAE